MTFRELFWMSEARLHSEWSIAVAAIRATGFAFVGKDKPFMGLIPKRFRPEFRAAKSARVDPETNRRRVWSALSSSVPLKRG